MNKAFIVITLAFSSVLVGCPDKPDSAKPPATPSAAAPANAPGAAPATSATTGSGGW